MLSVIRIKQAITRTLVNVLLAMHLDCRHLPPKPNILIICIDLLFIISPTQIELLIIAKTDRLF